MKKIIFVLILVILIAGYVTSPKATAQSNPTKVKVYSKATLETKQQLFEDLQSGKLGIGAKFEYIRETYGDPDFMGMYKNLGNVLKYVMESRVIILNFKNGKNLSSWSN